MKRAVVVGVAALWGTSGVLSGAIERHSRKLDPAGLSGAA